MENYKGDFNTGDLIKIKLEEGYNFFCKIKELNVDCLHGGIRDKGMYVIGLIEIDSPMYWNWNNYVRNECKLLISQSLLKRASKLNPEDVTSELL